MSFIIRQVAKRADGGDIIRTRTLPSTEISVGRGTDCDIQLADLAVMLRHARLVQTAPGRVSVETTGGVPVTVAGKFATRADVLLADAPAIDIGPFRLTLSAADDGAVAVTAERVVPPIDTADAAQEIAIFSLQGAMPTRRRLAWVGALAVLAVMLVLPLLHILNEDRAALPPAMAAQAARIGTTAPAFGLKVAQPRAVPQGGPAADELWSTGPLSNAHASLSNNCGACHNQAFVSVTDSSCQACHTPTALPGHAPANRLARSQGPEGGITGVAHQLFNLPQGRCTSCHKEHEGEATVMTVAQSFCTDCHAGMQSRLANTQVADVANWPRHPEFRATLVSAPAATTPQFIRAVLAGARENSGLIYPHDLHQSTRNAVANMAQKQGLPVGSDGALPCSYCHMPDSDQLRFKPITMAANCSACHDLAFARDGDTLRTLPHGQPAQVAGIIRDFTLAQGGKRIGLDRRLPGRAAAAAPDRLSPAAAVQAVFSKGGLCSECHVVSTTGAAELTKRFAIAPVSINDHYLPQGRFPHGQHKSYDGKTGEAACRACHTGVLTSKRADDVLIPGVATCRECHGAPPKTLLPAAAKAGDSCDTCHGFHEGGDSRAPLPVGHGATPARLAATRSAAGRS